MCGDTVFDESIAKESIGDAGDGGMHPALLVQHVKYSSLFWENLQKKDSFITLSLLMTVAFSCLSSPARISLYASSLRLQRVPGQEDWEASSSIAIFALIWYCSSYFKLKLLALTVVAITMRACARVMMAAYMNIA